MLKSSGIQVILVIIMMITTMIIMMIMKMIIMMFIVHMIMCDIKRQPPVLALGC